MSRRFQFSLRALLVALLVISVALGIKTAAARRQMAAISKLRAKGADIVIEPAVASGGSLADRLKDALGMTSQTVKVDLLEESPENNDGIAIRTIVDDDVLLIGDVYDATDVWVSSDHITAKSLRAFSALPRLQRLYLATASITDNEIGELQKCKRLKLLHLYFASIGDAGVDCVAAIPSLEQLCLYPVVATNESAVRLGQLNRLKELVLCEKHLDPTLETRLEKMLPQCFVVVQGTGLSLIGVKDEASPLATPDPR